MVIEILSSAESLTRNLSVVGKPMLNNNSSVSLVTLAGSSYVKKFKDFASRMHITLGNSNIRIETVHCTSPSLSQLLFNNGNVRRNSHILSSDGCAACRHHMVNDTGVVCSSVTGRRFKDTGVVCSSVTGRRFKVDNNLNCSDDGIYVIDTTCTAQYTGKTIHYGVRSNEHFLHGGTAISPHIQNCHVYNNVANFKFTLVENYVNRGKYSLSEREYLWNSRIRVIINTHKTLGM